MKQTESAKELQASLYRSMPLYEHIEARVEALGDRVRCSVPLTAENQNHLGAVHAALQFAACEMSGALAVSRDPAIRSGGHRLVVKSLSIDYLKPALTDVTASAGMTDAQRVQLIRGLADDGKAEVELDIELADAAGQPVARATGRYHISVTRSDAAT